MDIKKIVENIVDAGWSADLGGDPIENLEALVHEMAHNLILGDLTPKTMDRTDHLIVSKTPGRLGDSDEILATAVTIQILEQYFNVRGTVINDALLGVSMNVKAPHLTACAADMVFDLIGSKEVVSLAEQLFGYMSRIGKKPSVLS